MISGGSTLLSVLVLLAVVVAAVGGALATLASRKILILSRAMSLRVEAAERRLLVTQVKMITEGVISEAFHVENLSNLLKKMMIEEAIADGTHTSTNLTGAIESIDKQTKAVTRIQREAVQRGIKGAAIDSLNIDKLSKILTNSESQLIKIRQIRTMFERKLQSSSQDGHFVSNAA